MTEKKDATISFSVTPSMKSKLLALSEMEGVTLSEYGYRIFSAHVAEKEAEARLLAQALGIQIKDI